MYGTFHTLSPADVEWSVTLEIRALDKAVDPCDEHDRREARSGFYEYDCHEGNYALREPLLSAARAATRMMAAPPTPTDARRQSIEDRRPVIATMFRNVCRDGCQLSRELDARASADLRLGNLL